MSIPVLSRRLAASFFISAFAAAHPAAAQDVSRAADVARSISPDIVISQVYGGGGNAGALYKNDFIELFNRGASPVSIAGWSVQYASAAGTSYTSKTNITAGVLNPGQYFLIQEAAGTGGTQNLPTPDVTGTIAMSGTAGKVALVMNQVVLTCGATNCHNDPSVRDFVGYGTTATDFEGSGPTAAPANATAALRDLNGCEDTDDNASDFAIVNPPVPRNTSSPANSCGGPTAPTGVAAANPSSVPTGGASLLTVAVTPGGNPTSTGLAVAADLTNIGGANPAQMFDDGTHGDVTAGDLVFSLNVTVAANTPSGPRVLTFTISDAQLRSSTTTTTISVQAVARTIHEIQGTLARSPFDGQLVTTRGIVTARKINGFFLQLPDAEADADPATSEGVFVFTSSAPPAAAAVGNEVSVTGTVQEFIPSADPNSPPTTEIAFTPSVALLSTGNLLPTPIEMTPSAAIDGQPFEYLEGMRIHVNSLTVVAPTAGNVSEPNASSTSTGLFYGVLTGTPRPFREPGINILDPLPPGAPANIPRFDENPERIRVDSRGQEGAAMVEVSTGAVLANITGVLDFGFRCYTIAPDAGTVADQVGAAVPVRPRAADEFTVAAFNLERFFDTVNDPNTSDPVLTPAALDRRMQKASLAIRTVMRSPDILGVEEAENLGVLQTLATRLNADTIAAGDPDPGYVAHLVEGNDIGGIDVGFLVRTEHVAVGAVEQVGLNATYINPTTGLPELLNDRPPLVLRAAVTVPGGPAFPVVVVVNHLRSLLGMDDPGPGGVRVRAKRAAQAEFLAELVDTLQGEAPRAAVVTVGDFNAFEVNDGYVDVMGAIKGNPAPADQVVTHANDLIDPDLINLVETIPTAGGQRYSYVFDGNAQVLDHVLITAPLSEKVRGIQYARNDADFPESLRNVATRPERLSDHDMPVAFFRYPAADLALGQTASTLVSGGTVTYTVTATNGGPDAIAEQVTVTDPLPALLTFDAVSAAGWTCTTPPVGSGGTVSCARAEIATTAAVLVSARVGCAVPNGTVITNTATMTSAWDPVAGNNTAAATVTVSNPAPVVANAAANPPVITVPNRKWIDVTVSYNVTDNCDPTPSCSLTVTTNDNAPGNRNPPVDWTITDEHHVQVRATRNGRGEPRVYTIAIRCTDVGGAIGTGSTTVTVN
jgi:uncharacterized repeat protein (TIGR01451 family)